MAILRCWTTKPAYLRDVYDHLVHLLETVDMQRDLIAGMVDLYISTQSNQMNRQMRF